MNTTHKSENYYAMELIEEEGKTFVLFYDPNDNLLAKCEIPQQVVAEDIR